MSLSARIRRFPISLAGAAIACFTLAASAADEDFTTLTKRLQSEKAQFAKRQQDLLADTIDRIMCQTRSLMSQDVSRT